MEEGASASVIAETLLWPQIESDQLQSLWQELKAALLAAKQDWQVWTTWYEDRLQCHVRDEARELVYVRIEEALWGQGPAIVNAEIKRLIEELEPPQHDVVQVQARISSAASMSADVSLSVAEPTLPVPVENIPSAVSFDWTSRGTITVIAGAQNWPVLPFTGGPQDHANRLDACRVLAPTPPDHYEAANGTHDPIMWKRSTNISQFFQSNPRKAISFWRMRRRVSSDTCSLPRETSSPHH